MKRNVYHDLLNWKNSPDRKPLLLQGARQVGKTWLMEEFGKNEYKNVVSLNFEKTPRLSAYFDENISPANIIKSLEQHFDTIIDPPNTLIIFDEVQESARALNSLKYFYEEAPQYNIMAAGSFLGVAMHGRLEGNLRQTGSGFPVGKVNRITLYPFSFYEFLDGIGKSRYTETIKQKDFDLIRAQSFDYAKLLKIYFHVGGMPKAIAAYAARENLREVRAIQNDILADYKDDFSKHISTVNIPKVEMIWNSIPRHLSREKKKFMYKELKSGARAYAYEDALNWLFDTRLVYKIARTEEIKLPLASFANEGIFKLFMLDIGLFGAKSGLDITAIPEPDNELFGIYNGAMTEQFVMQELMAADFSPYYWGREKGAAEVDFVVQWRNEIIPVEVKAGLRKKSKSLEVYRNLYNPAKSVRTTLKNFSKINDLYSIPLYMIASISDLLQP